MACTASKAGLAGDDHALAAARADHAVGGDRELQRDVRPALGDARDVAGMARRAASSASTPVVTAMPASLQLRVALPRGARIGIVHRR